MPFEWPLVGRLDELELVERALARPEAAGVLLAGEAGVGKTALVRAFCDGASAPARVLWGACDALFTQRPLGPFVDAAWTTAASTC